MNMKVNSFTKKIFFIAEAGVNHNGSLTIAKQLIDTAKEAGADAVKFQSFHADDLVCFNAPKAEYQKKTTFSDHSQYEMLKSLELSESEQITLFNYCQSKKILFMSSPFDLISAHFIINNLNSPIIKIPSGEITNLPLLVTIARSGKKVILSTGMCTLGEIEIALSILAHGYIYPNEQTYPTLSLCEDTYHSKHGQSILQNHVTLLHCTTEYPAPFEEVNLRVLKTLKSAFKLPVGYSDHTLGTAVSIAAVACGAQVIEKHFTLDKTLPGPDHQASLEPNELAFSVKSIRQVELALGTSKKIPSSSEFKNRSIARKSLVALKSIKQGDQFDASNMGCKRPGSGISAIYYSHFTNLQADRDYEQDELIGIAKRHTTD